LFQITVQLQTGWSCGIGCYDYVGFPGFFHNYTYKIARPEKDGNTTICKVRGITLNYKNSLTINFDTTKDMVIDNRDDVKTVRDDFKITRDHKRLLTVHQDKDYISKEI
jgi:hypothetical protein